MDKLSMDLLALVALQHKQTMLLLQQHVSFPMQGLAAAAKPLLAQGKISSHTARKLRSLDWTYGYLRKVSQTSVEHWLRNLERELGGSHYCPSSETEAKCAPSLSSLSGADSSSLPEVYQEMQTDKLDMWLYGDPTACVDALSQTELSWPPSAQLVQVERPDNEHNKVDDWSTFTFSSLTSPPEYVPPCPCSILEEAIPQSPAPSDESLINEGAAKSGDSPIDVTDLEARFAKLEELCIDDSTFRYGASSASSSVQDDIISEDQVAALVGQVPQQLNIGEKRACIRAVFAKAIRNKPKQVQQMCTLRDQVILGLQ
jgi:hypothetical protein